MRNRLSAPRTGLVALALGVLLGACGDDSSDESSSTTTAAASTATTVESNADLVKFDEQVQEQLETGCTPS